MRPSLKKEWLAALDSVEPFAKSRPYTEIGCLYYSKSEQTFVDARQVMDAVPHFGRPGGILPQINRTHSYDDSISDGRIVAGRGSVRSSRQVVCERIQNDEPVIVLLVLQVFAEQVFRS